MPGSKEEVRLGETKRFECQVVGFPRPEIRWFKDEVDITENPRYKFNFHDDGVISLLIENISAKDEGAYKCLAKNTEGTASTTAYLLVKVDKDRHKDISIDEKIAFKSRPLSIIGEEEEEEAEKHDKESTKEEELRKQLGKKPVAAPQFVEKPNDITVNEGETITITCKISGVPKPEVMWFKGGDPLFADGERIEIVQMEDEYTLTIKEAKPSDGGAFTVTASSTEGSVYYNVSVSVIAVKREKSPTPEREILEVAPEFIKQPLSQKIIEAEKVRFSCLVQGKPEPTVTWFKDGKLLKSDSHRKIYKAEGLHFLELPKASIEDGGEYTCTANNSAGAVYCNFALTVETVSEHESSADLDEQEALRKKKKAADAVQFKEYALIKNYTDQAKKIAFREGEIVQVLDALNPDSWLVRKKKAKEQVAYIPSEFLKKKDGVPDDKQAWKDALEEISEVKERDRAKGKQATPELVETSSDDEKLAEGEKYPIYVAVADYIPPKKQRDKVQLTEGQFVEVLDKKNPEWWLVRTKPTKLHPAKQGWVPASRLEKRDGAGLVDRRNTREVFREDIIQITNKGQEANVKRRYALKELLESEHDYLNNLHNVVDTCIPPLEGADVPEPIKGKKDLIFANLEDIMQFHQDTFLPQIMACTSEPEALADLFLSQKAKLEEYIPYLKNRKAALKVLNTEPARKFTKKMKEKKAGEEQTLPELLKKPKQRLQQYQSVVKDFIRYTARAGADCSKLEEAHDMLGAILKQADDKYHRDQIEGYPGDLADLGNMVRHDDFQMWDAEPEGHGKDRHIFLFPDKLLITKKKKPAVEGELPTYIYKGIINLPDLQLNEDAPGDDRRFELWYAEPSVEKVTLQPKNVHKKQAWLKDLRELLTKLGVKETDIPDETLEQLKTKKPKVPSVPKKKPEKKKKGTDVTDAAPKDKAATSAEAPGLPPEDERMKPKFKKAPFDTKANEGDQVKFEIQVTGNPEPEITWFKGAQQIAADGTKYTFVFADDEFMALIVKDLKLSDAGLYYCRAKNYVGEAEVKIKLEVKGQKSKDARPSFPSKMRSNMNITEGNPVELKCTVAGFPEPDVMWQLNGKPLKPSANIEMKTEGDQAVLSIKNATPNDSGVYTCKITNKLGHAQCSSTVTVKPDMFKKKEVAKVAPTFTAKFKDVEVTPKRDTYLECKIKGSPAPEVTWYHNNKPLKDSKHIKMEKIGDMHILNIYKVTPEDEGEYTCKAVNTAGEVSHSARVSVAKPKEPTFSGYAPQFSKKVYNVDAVEGEKAKFECRVMGDPEPDVQWFKDGQPLQPGRKYKMEKVRGSTTLTISDVTKADAGEYTCTAANPGGKVSSAAMLDVQAAKPKEKSPSKTFGKAEEKSVLSKQPVEPVVEKKGETASSPSPEEIFMKTPEPTKEATPILEEVTSKTEIESKMTEVINKKEETTKTKFDDIIETSKTEELMEESISEEKKSTIITEEIIPSSTVTAEESTVEEAEIMRAEHSTMEVMLEMSSANEELFSEGAETSGLQYGRDGSLPRMDELGYVPHAGDLYVPATPYTPRVRTPVIERPRIEDYADRSIKLAWSPPHIPALEERYRLPESRTSTPISVAYTLPSGRSYMPRPSVESHDYKLSSKLPEAASYTVEPPRKFKYIIEGREPHVPEWRRLVDRLPDTLSYSIKDLTPERDYMLRVRVEDEKGLSEPSLPVLTALHKPRDKRAEEIHVPPEFPYHEPIITNFTERSLELSWSPARFPDRARKTPIRYVVEIQEAPSYDWRKLVDGLKDTTFTVLTLKPDKDYAFRVRAVNDYGISEPTLPVSTAYLKKPGAGHDFDTSMPTRRAMGDMDAPRVILDKPRLEDLGDGSIRITWTHSTLPGFSPRTPEIRYIIEVSEPPSKIWRKVIGALAEPNYVIKNLRPDQDYLFRVRAQNDYGVSEPSLPVSTFSLWRIQKTPYHPITGVDITFDKVPPRLSEKPYITGYDNHSLRLHWSPVVMPGHLGSPLVTYTIEMREPSQQWRELATGVNGHHFSVNHLDPEKDYMFRVIPVNEYGPGEPSVPVPTYLYRKRAPFDYRPSPDFYRDRRAEAPPEFLPHKPTICDYHGDSFKLSWSPAQTSDKGIPSAITYIVECREPHHTDWRQLATNLTDFCYTVRGLDKNKDYILRVRPENEFGIGEPTLPVSTYLFRKPDYTPTEVGDASIKPRKQRERSLDSPRRSQTPQTVEKPCIPYFTVDNPTQYAAETKAAKIIVYVHAYPPPKIRWYKGEEKLPLGERFNSYLAPNGLCTLEFNRMTPKDVGDYKIWAQNDLGQDCTTIRLELADPPTFLEPIKDIFIPVRTSGRLECRVDGIPYPDVKWMKDWRALPGSYRVSIQQEGPDKWTLNINNAIDKDGGLYTCVAENLAGKVFCSANVHVEDLPEPVEIEFKPLYLEDHYHILEELGRGSCGIVRRVIERCTGHEYAAKYLQVRDEDDKQDLRPILDTWKKANHRLIAKLVDAYETPKRLVMVSDLATGGELFDKVVHEDNLNEARAAFYIQQLLEALQHLQDNNVLHLDIKPENILLSRHGLNDIKLIDFGNSRIYDPKKKLLVKYGNPEFVAPEVVRGDPVGQGTDLWGVGVVAYVLLSGVSPFLGKTNRETLEKVKEGAWTFDPEGFAGVSEKAKQFIGDLLNPDESKRPTLSQCLKHPWIKLADVDAPGTRLPTEKLREFVSRRKWQRTLGAVKFTVKLKTIEDLLAEPDEEMPAPPGDDFSSGEEDAWYEWYTRYQGDDTKLLPTVDSMPVRLREYRREQGEKSDIDLPIPEGKESDPELVRKKTMKARQHLADVEEEDAARRALAGAAAKVDDQISQMKAKKREQQLRMVEEGFPPIFREKIKDRAYNVGEPVTLRCHALASPPPTISWYRNDQMITSSDDTSGASNRVRVSQSEDGHLTLTLLNTLPNDSGVYKCVARNKLGTATCRARLMVGDVPDRPGRPAVSQVSGTEVFLIWDAPKFDGNTHIIAYKVDYRREGEERWTTASYTIDECALVTDLSPETEYRFRVSCLNRFGVSPYSWSSQEVTTKSAGEAPLSREKMRQCKKIDIQGDADLSPELRDFESARERGEVPLIERNPAEDYEFAGELWRGNFSVVRSCGRKDMPATLAAKIIAFTPSNRSQVLHEFEILKTLNQERIVRLHEAFTTPDHLILIMDRLYGENILQFLSYKNKYTEETVAKVMRQVIDAVQYLHHQGVVHLNIQPDNVMMASRRRLDVRLGDFGCARIITDPMGEKMTQVGAPEFMSPEMACGEKVGFPSDVWQVGVLAFILLSGESPFLGENDEKTLENTRSVRYDSHSLYENITKDAFKYIQETLKREPSHRLTADELHEHPWLQLTEAMVKKREAARFVTNKLRQFADEYGKRRQADATKSEKLINAFGPPAGAAAVDSDSDGEFTPKSPIAVRKTSDQTQRQRHTEKQLVLPEPKGDSDSGITTQDSDTSSVDGRPIPKMTKRHR